MARPATSRRLVSLDECADYLGISKKTLRRYIASGLIPAYRIGGRTLRVDLNIVDEALVKPIPTAQSHIGPVHQRADGAQ